MNREAIEPRLHTPSATGAVVWDMDGTLIDTSLSVPAAFAQVLERLTGRQFSNEEIIALYPLGPPAAIFTHVLGRPASEIDLDAYHTVLAQRLDGVVVYPRIIEALERVNEHAFQAVFTGASREAAHLLLHGTGLERYFVAILTGDDATRKPSPRGLLEICSRLGVAPARAAYVGDSSLDMEAAVNAGMVAIRASWGHLAHQTIDRPDVLQADTPDQVVDFLFGDQELS